ncbi:MAG: CBS domain-containing protein [Betaproteobacteria bacterium]|nr:CBS domain-containing protein [Betaproteobacteria bacterium]
MNVSEIMSTESAWCTERSTVREVARLMAENHCAVLPVIAEDTARTPLGVITDRDLVMHLVGGGRGSEHVSATKMLTRAPVNLGPETDVEDAARTMLQYELQNALVVSDEGTCIGTLALGALASVLQEVRDPDVRENSSAQGYPAPRSAARAPSETAIDEGIGETFPASDPVSVQSSRK